MGKVSLGNPLLVIFGGREVLVPCSAGCAVRGARQAAGRLLAGPRGTLFHLWGGRLDQFREIVSFLTEHRFPEVADLGATIHFVLDPEVLDLDSLFDLAPRNWCGYSGERSGTHGVHRGEGSAPGVLVVVDVDRAVRAFYLAVLRRRDLRIARFHLQSDSFRDCPYFFLERASDDGNVDVDSARSGRLRIRGHLQGLEKLA